MQLGNINRRASLKLLFFVLILAAPIYPLWSQTCSCGGAQLVNSQSLSAVEKGNLVLGITTDYNKIDRLYNGTNELNNRSAERETFTSLMEANYGLTSRITLSGTFTHVIKSRKTGLQNSGATQQVHTSGIGDALLMLKYSLLQQTLWKPYQLMFGGGVKVPLATNSLSSNGLALNADMQPGTGSWDGVGWMYFSYTFRAQNLTLFTVNFFKKTSAASRFNEDDQYQFGDEFNSMIGINKPAFNRFSYSLKLKYKTAKSDLRNNSMMFSTGGEWMNIEPSVNYAMTERLSLQLSGEIPLYQNVNGTQPSTTYILTASLFFSLNKSNTGFNFGLPNNN